MNDDPEADEPGTSGHKEEPKVESLGVRMRRIVRDAAKWLLTAGGVGAAVIWCFEARPVVTIESQAIIDPKDPYGSVFVITNTGKLAAKALTASCVIREMQFEGGYEMDSWQVPPRKENTFTTDTLISSDKIAITCPQYFTIYRKAQRQGAAYEAGFSSDGKKPSAPVGFNPLTSTHALAEVSVTYRTPWRSTEKRYRRFLGRRDFEGRLIWAATADSVRLLGDKPEHLRCSVRAVQDPSNPDAYSYEFSVHAGPNTKLK